MLIFILVMHTLYANVDKALPTTSYMKVVEWWLLYHIIIPIIIFFILFLDNHRKQIVQQFNGTSLHRVITVLDSLVFFGKFLLPGVSVLFVVVFVTIVTNYRLSFVK